MSLFLFILFYTYIHSFIQSHSYNTFIHRHSPGPLSEGGTSSEGWVAYLDWWVAKLVARLLFTASSPGSIPDISQISQIGDISKGEVANTLKPAKNIQRGNIFRFFSVLYSPLLHLQTLRCHCGGECWDRTQDSSDFGIGCQSVRLYIYSVN